MTITKGRNSYTLRSTVEDTSPTVNLLSSLQLKRELRKGRTAYLAVIREVLEEGTKLEIEGPTEEWKGRLIQVLEKHQKIFEPLPKGLPPERAIDHHIDLEPGARPPYLPTYHMSPLELAELKKQLAELIDMGYIQPYIKVTLWGTRTLCAQEEREVTYVCGLQSSQQAHREEPVSVATYR